MICEFCRDALLRLPDGSGGREHYRVSEKGTTRVGPCLSMAEAGDEGFEDGRPPQPMDRALARIRDIIARREAVEILRPVPMPVSPSLPPVAFNEKAEREPGEEG